ncbi:MAG: hypothetical protein AB4038_22480 [Prochloraceae cyanobacterium]
MSKDFNQSESSELVESSGPWPFITRRTYRRADNLHVVWQSRHHRKGLHRVKPSKLEAFGARLLRSLWMPRQLNWWIGVIFAAGSLLFMLGSVSILVPGLAKKWSLDPSASNAIFFTGSIPFTSAAYLQLFQAANAGKFSPQGRLVRRPAVWFGWDPRDIGWLSCALQFLGTLLFNINTFDAMLPGLNWLQQDLSVWAPDLLGSFLFLASGYLAFIETCHAHWAWKPASISWWVTFVNFLGCVAFMISAMFAFVPPRMPSFDALTISVTFTLIGALGFLIGSLLMLPETAMPAKAHA